MGTRSQNQLTRADWCDAAMDALARKGVAAVAIEPLAKSLGVTKGSGYWHFENRDALLEATLAAWEERTTTRTIERLSAVADPRDRLAQLLRQALSKDLDSRITVALMTHDTNPVIAKALRRVSKRRLQFLEDCYRAFLADPDQAPQRAAIAYAAYLGLILLRRHGAGRTSGPELIEGMIATLV